MKIITMIVSVLILASQVHAIERTSDIVFETFERIDGRLGDFESERTALDRQIKEAREDAKAAIAHIRKSQAHGNEVSAEEGRTDLLLALAKELGSQQQKVRRAREVYLANRTDLKRLIPHLRSHGFGRTKEGKLALSQLVSNARRFGNDVKGMLLYFSRLDKSAEDPRVRSKIASATGSLQALSRSLGLLKARQQAVEAGSSKQLAETVEAYIDAMDSALAQLAMAGELLNEKQDQLQVANRLSTLRLIAIEINDAPLSPNQPNNLIDKLIEDVERMDTEATEHLYPGVDMERREDGNLTNELEGLSF